MFVELSLLYWDAFAQEFIVSLLIAGSNQLVAVCGTRANCCQKGKRPLRNRVEFSRGVLVSWAVQGLASLIGLIVTNIHIWNP